jgi:hypothetical protein
VSRSDADIKRADAVATSYENDEVEQVHVNRMPDSFVVWIELARPGGITVTTWMLDMRLQEPEIDTEELQRRLLLVFGEGLKDYQVTREAFTTDGVDEAHHMDTISARSLEVAEPALLDILTGVSHGALVPDGVCSAEEAEGFLLLGGARRAADQFVALRDNGVSLTSFSCVCPPVGSRPPWKFLYVPRSCSVAAREVTVFDALGLLRRRRVL